MSAVYQLLKCDIMRRVQADEHTSLSGSASAPTSSYEDPGHVGTQQPVYLLDALGRTSPFHLEFIRSAGVSNPCTKLYPISCIYMGSKHKS